MANYYERYKRKKTTGMRVLGRSRTMVNYVMAEEEGFEPSVRINVHTLSKRAPSATRTLFRYFLANNIS